MLRIAITGMLAVAFAAAASAQSTPTTPTKTGYLIPGCTYYVIDTGNGKMTKICDRLDARDAKDFWIRNDRLNGGSSGGSGQ